jgi:anti-sigma factor RsiW
MNCNEADTLIAAYADGELDRLRAHAIERHFRGCTGCASAHKEMLALSARIRAEAPYFPATAALRARVDATLGAVQAEVPARVRPPNDRWRWLGGGALAGCAATVLAWTLGSAVIAMQASQDLVTEAVTTHVRATLGNRLIQVASSDQHTVKPWLSARLDYSPPVQDYANEGFPLVGGRLDTLDRQPVATLVYRYRLHTIDVYVRPASTRALALTPRSLRGFNVVEAAGSGMDWVAVSDVSADVLTAFVNRLAQQAPTP